MKESLLPPPAPITESGAASGKERVGMRGSDLWGIMLGLAAGLLLFHQLATWTRDFDPSLDGPRRDFIGFAQATLPDGSVVKDRPEKIAVTGRGFAAQGLETVLLLGASQLHSISKYAPGQMLAIYHANERAIQRGAPIRYLQLSSGNASAYMLLSLYLQVRERGFIPNYVVIAVVYDDFGEPQMIADPGLRAIPADLEDEDDPGLQDLKDQLRRWEADQAVTSAPTGAKNPQQRLEEFLTTALARVWPQYGERENLRGRLVIEFRALVRRMLGTYVERPVVRVPAEVEARNLRGLNTLLRVLQKDGVKVVAYRAPHRQDLPVFYHDRAEYDAFFGRIEALRSPGEVDVIDWEKLVPGEFYGRTTTGFPDVFHFNELGHVVLGDALDEYFEERSRTERAN
jgi:hypothetical protein